MKNLLKRFLYIATSTLLIHSVALDAVAQTFTRSELAPSLESPWEITFGPDGYLWLTEAGGKVSRVHPETGTYEVVYTAPDYFSGAEIEKLNACHQPWIGHGTLGLALHPDFQQAGKSFVYFVYSYNSGTESQPSTKFKIRRISWDAASESVTKVEDILDSIPTSYDHLGGRLISVKEATGNFLYLSVGDHGISETNSPDCYANQRDNPNELAQDYNTWNGKIHRFNMDGSIPDSNPVKGNSMFTRGHRNPQGLMYNPELGLLYEVEHGDRTDDEINILKRGANYGWKQVRGYLDGNHPGELDFAADYAPSPTVQGDRLVHAIYAWCANEIDTTSDNSNWCTVAPSDGIYYGANGIPGWYNSLLVVTLKDGADTDMELYRFQLTGNGSLAPSTAEQPNPSRFFGEDQHLNGRLRDVAYSPDGSKLFLLNNGGAPTSKITVYEVIAPEKNENDCGLLFPNPAVNEVTVWGWSDENEMMKAYAISTIGEIQILSLKDRHTLNLSNLKSGFYTLVLEAETGTCHSSIVKLFD